MALVPQQAFGLTLSPDVQLPGLRSSDPSGPRLSIQLAGPRELTARAGSGPGEVLWTTVMDDAQAVRLERTPAGGHRFEYGRRAAFVLSPEGDTILCAPAEGSDPSWQRFLLDTVLATTSLLHGFEALHASSVESRFGLIVVLASMEGGKTSLALELIRRGGTLFCDDVLALEKGPAEVLAHPGPALMNISTAAYDREPQPGGRPLATFGDEVWLEVATPPAPPRRPAALFLLQRGLDCDEAVVGLEPNPLPLLAHALGVRGTRDRAHRRFDLLADLAAQVPIYRLQAAAAVPPDGLADLVEEALEARSPSMAGVGA